MGRFSKLEVREAAQPKKSERVAKPLRKSSGAAPLSYDSTMRDADERFYQGDWKEAIRLYSRALQLDNSQVAPWVGQVIALLFQGQLREADAWAKRSLECFPDHPAAVSIHGLVFVLQGMTKRGIGSSDYAMGLGADDPVAWIARGWMLLEADNKNWKNCFMKALEICPSDEWKMHTLSGFILEHYKKWPQAVERFRQAADQQTGNFYLWHHLGICYSKLGVARKAIEAQKHVLSIDPDYHPAKREIKRLSGFSLFGIFKRLFRRHR